MSNYTIKKASIQDNLDLSKKLWIKGVSAEESLVWLKSVGYKQNNINYQATSVAQGIAMLTNINEAIKAGTLSATKTKGLHVKG